MFTENSSLSSHHSSLFSLDIAKENPSSPRNNNTSNNNSNNFGEEFEEDDEEFEENNADIMEEEFATPFHWTDGGNNVYLVGSFTKWLENKVPMKKEENKENNNNKNNNNKHDVWSALVFLKVGIYSYKFIVDGEWRYATDQTKITDENGNINNCLSVTFPRRRLSSFLHSLFLLLLFILLLLLFILFY